MYINGNKKMKTLEQRKITRFSCVKIWYFNYDCVPLWVLTRKTVFCVKTVDVKSPLKC